LPPLPELVSPPLPLLVSPPQPLLVSPPLPLELEPPLPLAPPLENEVHDVIAAPRDTVRDMENMARSLFIGTSPGFRGSLELDVLEVARHRPQGSPKVQLGGQRSAQSISPLRTKG
jgi:hypothetical protein